MEVYLEMLNRAQHLYQEMKKYPEYAEMYSFGSNELYYFTKELELTNEVNPPVKLPKLSKPGVGVAWDDSRN